MPGGTHGDRPSAPAAPGRTRPRITLILWPTPATAPCRRSPTAPLHRVLYRSHQQPQHAPGLQRHSWPCFAPELGLLTSQGRRPKHLQNATSRETPQRMVCRGLRCVVTEKRFILKIYRSSLPLRDEERSDASRVAVHLPVCRGLYQARSIAGGQTCAHLCARFSHFV